VKQRRDNARHEVTTKSAATVERETANKWAARAIACYTQCVETGELRWRLRGDDYRHEALEHAALIGDNGKTVARLQVRIDRVRKRCAGRR
jgi:hypothetical protein